MSDLTQKSKYLSMLLRHSPEKANLTLDKEGWCEIEQLLNNTTLTMGELQQIVENDSKGRYSFDEHVECIRANQGHSTSKVKLTFKVATPPTVLYHGTNTKAYEIIRKHGILPMSRHHVHLSADEATAVSVADRRKKETLILKIDAKKMLADGLKFYISDNGVWLADHIQAKYITVME